MNIDVANEDRHRSLGVIGKYLVSIVAVLMSLFHIYALGLTVLSPWVLATLHLLFGTILGFALFNIPTKNKVTTKILNGIDLIVICLAAATYGFVLIEMESLLDRAGYFPTTLDLIFGTSAILLTLELTRRTTGWALPIVAIIAISYALLGDYIPGMLGHRGYSTSRIVSFVFSLEGIFSTPLQVSSKYIFLFVLFGAFLQVSGAGSFFLNFASSLVGTIRGGPAQIAVFASALFGTISGSAVANTAGTGAVTIPLMKKVGYRASFAAAVEAVASTGGQIMPPIMGASAFIIADIVGVTYLEVATAALIPAILYFATVIISVDIEAVKSGLKGIPREDLQRPILVLRKDGHLMIPLLVLLGSLAILHTSPIRAALFAILSMVVVSWIRKSSRMGINKIISALIIGAKNSLEVLIACATAGIVVAVLNLTGLGQIIAAVIVELSQGIIFFALLLSMIVCIILGMGLPTTPAYIIAASVVAPALVQLNVDPMQAHLFVFYFSCIAVITPPVALASYTAAGIAKANPTEVGLVGVRLAIVAFLIPFMFVFDELLIGNGSLLNISMAIITALLGVFSLACGVHKFLYFELSGPKSIFLIIGSLALIFPGLESDIVGIIIFLIVFFSQRSKMNS